MIRKIARGLVMSGAILIAAAALAQPPKEDGSGEPPAAETPAAAADKPAENREPAGAGDKQGDSPYDYQASEEISEDLPVSFPVDI